MIRANTHVPQPASPDRDVGASEWQWVKPSGLLRPIAGGAQGL